MKLDTILDGIREESPVAIVVINEFEDHYTSRTYGRICQDKVTEILEDIVKQMKDEQQKAYDEIKNQLPF